MFNGNTLSNIEMSQHKRMNSIKSLVKAALGWNWTLQGPVDLSGTSEIRTNYYYCHPCLLQYTIDEW